MSDGRSSDSQILLMLGELKGTTTAIHKRLDVIDNKQEIHSAAIADAKTMAIITKTKLTGYAGSAGLIGSAVMLYAKKFFE